MSPGFQSRSTQTRSLWAAACVSLLVGCPEAGPPPGEAERRAMLTHVASEVIVPELETFEGATTSLATAAADWRDGAGSPTEADELEAARASWRSAMASWQRAEQYQVGPAAPPQRAMGGQALRDELYSWPVVNPCRIDQELVARGYEEADFFDVSLVNVYGLDALEYLLFHDGPDNACPPQVDINQSGAWEALSEAELTERRAAYAATVAARVAEDAGRLLEAWTGADGFENQLALAGLEGSTFGTAQEALDELFAALFYLDLMTKDDKLATPSGVGPACLQETCPELRESQWADVSLAHVRENLEGFARLFQGGETPEAGTGFDDLLIGQGAPELATSMLAELAEAQTQAAALPDSMAQALSEDPEAVRLLHARVKALTDLMKSQMVTVLNLRVPQEGAADND